MVGPAFSDAMLWWFGVGGLDHNLPFCDGTMSLRQQMNG